jgi:hypothetical protein
VTALLRATSLSVFSTALSAAAPSAGGSMAVTTTPPISTQLRSSRPRTLYVDHLRQRIATFHMASLSALSTQELNRDATMMDRLSGPLPHPQMGDLLRRTQRSAAEFILLVSYSTTRSPWSVLFSRRPPSSVTVTMSSIRTPNLPAR